MSLDPYSPCPCGSGKKLKFCCSDLVADIEKIQRMIEGDQPQAALEHLKGLLAKHPRRGSLLDMKARLELDLEDFQAAQSTINDYLAADPKNPSALALWATLIAATQSGSDAIPVLQDALELLGKEMPVRVFDAIEDVGHALLQEGSLLAGRAHLILHAGISPAEENRALEMLLQLNQVAGLPLPLRDVLRPKPCPKDAPWSGEFLQAMLATRRGQWRIAEEIYASLQDKVGPDPAIVFNLALVRGWLGKDQLFANGMHQFARLDVSEREAVDAEALAQIMNPQLVDPQLQSVCVEFTVHDEDLLNETFAEDDRFTSHAFRPEEFAALDEDAPRPRFQYVMLDKPTPFPAPGLAADDIPRVLAFLTLYGKRTDREAQLELRTVRDEKFDQVKTLLVEAAGETLGSELGEEVMGETSISDESLKWRWWLPPGISPAQRRKLVAEERRRSLLERWPAAPRAALTGQSPAEAAGNPALKIPLLASILLVEQAADDPRDLPFYNELREKLGVPAAESIDPESVDLDELCVAHVSHLAMDMLTVEQLTKLLEKVSILGARVAILLLAEELVTRAEHLPDVDLTKAFNLLVNFQPDLDRARDWIARAQQWSRAHNRSGAHWAVLNLELAIHRGDKLHAQNALDAIRTDYINEPGVAEATYQLLYQAGLIDPRAKEPQPSYLAMPAAAESVAAKPHSKLWTPESDTAEEPNVQPSKSVIWTP